MILRGGAAFMGDVVDHLGRRFAVSSFLVILAAVLDGFGLLLLVPLLGLFGEGETASALAWPVRALATLGVESREGQVIAFVLAFMALAILRGILLVVRDHRLNADTLAYVDHLRLRVLATVVHAPWSRRPGLRTSEIDHAVHTDISRIGNGTSEVLRLGAVLVMLVAQVSVALLLAPLLAATVFALVAVLLASCAPLLRSANRIGTQQTDRGRHMREELSRFLSGLKMVKAHGCEDRFLDRYGETLHAMRGTVRRFQQHVSVTYSVIQVATALFGGMTALLGLLVFSVDPATLAVMLIVLSRAAGMSRSLLRSAQSFAHMLPAYENLRAMERQIGRDAARGPTGSREQEIAPPPPDPPGETPQSGPMALSLQGVGFRYPEAPASALQDIDLTLPQGSATVLTGASGAGKTTLLDLVTGLLVPETGTVLCDGLPLTGARRAEFRRSIAYVEQNPVFFDASVRENLLALSGDRPDAAIAEALGLAEAEAFVAALPDGAETRIAPSGQLLSGGERQRLALARALLRAPRLLILDEALNAIDREAEGRILDRLMTLKPRMTILLVTHRIVPCAGVDRMLTLGPGGLSAALPAPREAAE